MSFTGKENHAISLVEARKKVKRFRDDPKKPIKIDSGFFGRDALLALLNQSDCVGIRYYYAEDDDGSATIVLAGEASDGSIITVQIMNTPFPCPPFCPEFDPLGS